MTPVSVPCISVIIPAYHSIATLSGCLDALRRQTWRSFEVILVNSSQEPDTERLVRTMYPEVRFEQSPLRLNPHEARNLGVELAQGELLVFTDPDCEAEPEWLAVLWQAFSEGRQAVVGAMDLLSPNWWEQGIHLLKFHWLLRELPPGTRKCAATANAAYGRRLWSRIGPFPPVHFASDGIVSHRAEQAGSPPWFLPSAVVRHRHLAAPKELWVQRFERGRDYAHARLEAMSPPSLATWLHLLGGWAALPWVVIRAARDAFRCSWGKACLVTLPVQAAGHFLWALGESYGAVESLFCKAGRKRERS
jgi:O-antigen biosynthesis protein